MKVGDLETAGPFVKCFFFGRKGGGRVGVDRLCSAGFVDTYGSK